MPRRQKMDTNIPTGKSASSERFLLQTKHGQWQDLSTCEHYAAAVDSAQKQLRTDPFQELRLIDTETGEIIYRGFRSLTRMKETLEGRSL